MQGAKVLVKNGSHRASGMRRFLENIGFLTLCFVCQDQVKTMEIELDEEKSSVELLIDRIERSREQVET